jgi:hypothetical protein
MAATVLPAAVRSAKGAAIRVELAVSLTAMEQPAAATAGLAVVVAADPNRVAAAVVVATRAVMAATIETAMISA